MRLMPETLCTFQNERLSLGQIAHANKYIDCIRAGEDVIRYPHASQFEVMPGALEVALLQRYLRRVQRVRIRRMRVAASAAMICRSSRIARLRSRQDEKPAPKGQNIVPSFSKRFVGPGAAESRRGPADVCHRHFATVTRSGRDCHPVMHKAFLRLLGATEVSRLAHSAVAVKRVSWRASHSASVPCCLRWVGTTSFTGAESSVQLRGRPSRQWSSLSKPRQPTVRPTSRLASPARTCAGQACSVGGKRWSWERVIAPVPHGLVAQRRKHVPDRRHLMARMASQDPPLGMALSRSCDGVIGCRGAV